MVMWCIAYTTKITKKNSLVAWIEKPVVKCLNPLQVSSQKNQQSSD